MCMCVCVFVCVYTLYMCGYVGGGGGGGGGEGRIRGIVYLCNCIMCLCLHECVRAACVSVFFANVILFFLR